MPDRTDPMKEAEIKRIEKVTEFPLPSEYRNLLLQFPPELEATLNCRPKDERAIFTDSATIIRWNKFFRAPDYEYEDSNGEICTFPRHHVVIGANAGGDFFHLNTKRKLPNVLLWCHEDGEYLVQSKDLPAFVRSILKNNR
ncbi:SMI1/KNR4 family protein [Aeoliella sp.]|uniref:SMI1/KNR4 family protein n=1 Tax=Aeoliella sp. TaxID=2795800 RepID=UPI003CCBC80B